MADFHQSTTGGGTENAILESYSTFQDTSQQQQVGEQDTQLNTEIFQEDNEKNKVESRGRVQLKVISKTETVTGAVSTKKGQKKGKSSDQQQQKKSEEKKCTFSSQTQEQGRIDERKALQSHPPHPYSQGGSSGRITLSKDSRSTLSECNLLTELKAQSRKLTNYLDFKSADKIEIEEAQQEEEEEEKEFPPEKGQQKEDNSLSKLQRLPHENKQPSSTLAQQFPQFLMGQKGQQEQQKGRYSKKGIQWLFGTLPVLRDISSANQIFQIVRKSYEGIGANNSFLNLAYSLLETIQSSHDRELWRSFVLMIQKETMKNPDVMAYIKYILEREEATSFHIGRIGNYVYDSLPKAPAATPYMRTPTYLTLLRLQICKKQLAKCLIRFFQRMVSTRFWSNTMSYKFDIFTPPDLQQHEAPQHMMIINNRKSLNIHTTPTLQEILHEERTTIKASTPNSSTPVGPWGSETASNPSIFNRNPARPLNPHIEEEFWDNHNVFITGIKSPTTGCLHLIVPKEDQGSHQPRIVVVEDTKDLQQQEEGSQEEKLSPSKILIENSSQQEAEETTRTVPLQSMNLNTGSTMTTTTNINENKEGGGDTTQESSRNKEASEQGADNRGETTESSNNEAAAAGNIYSSGGELSQDPNKIADTVGKDKEGESDIVEESMHDEESSNHGEDDEGDEDEVDEMQELKEDCQYLLESNASKTVPFAIMQTPTDMMNLERRKQDLHVMNLLQEFCQQKEVRDKDCFGHEDPIFLSYLDYCAALGQIRVMRGLNQIQSIHPTTGRINSRNSPTSDYFKLDNKFIQNGTPIQQQKKDILIGTEKDSPEEQKLKRGVVLRNMNVELVLGSSPAGNQEMQQQNEEEHYQQDEKELLFRSPFSTRPVAPRTESISANVLYHLVNDELTPNLMVNESNIVDLMPNNASSNHLTANLDLVNQIENSEASVSACLVNQFFQNNGFLFSQPTLNLKNLQKDQPWKLDFKWESLEGSQNLIACYVLSAYLHSMVHKNYGLLYSNLLKDNDSGNVVAKQLLKNLRSAGHLMD